MWNLNTLPNVVALYGLLVVALAIGVNGILQRSLLWRAGRPSPESVGHWWWRLDDLVQHGFLQRKVSRGKSGSAIAHLLVYFGFLVLTFTLLTIRAVQKTRRDARIAYQFYHKGMSRNYDHEWLKARTLHIKGIPPEDRSGNNLKNTLERILSSSGG
jgi:hypothetical protein